MKGSFSIDSLLAKKTNNRELPSPPAPSAPSSSALSPQMSSNGSSNPSTPSPEARLSPELSMHGKLHLKNSYIPRPSLINHHHQALLQSNPLAIQGLLQAQYLHALNSQHGHPNPHRHGAPLTPPHLPNSSAFHSPNEHAFKMAAHLHAAQSHTGHVQPYLNEWMSRGGMLMSRMMDYSGINIITIYFLLADIYDHEYSGQKNVKFKQENSTFLYFMHLGLYLFLYLFNTFFLYLFSNLTQSLGCGSSS